MIRNNVETENLSVFQANNLIKPFCLCDLLLQYVARVKQLNDHSVIIFIAGLSCIWRTGNVEAKFCDSIRLNIDVELYIP